MYQIYPIPIVKSPQTKEPLSLKVFKNIIGKFKSYLPFELNNKIFQVSSTKIYPIPIIKSSQTKEPQSHITQSIQEHHREI